MLLKKYPKVDYKKLPKKLQESYNFQKASSILADYGFVTNLLKYDWMGADFLAQHKDGDWLKVQLKGTLTSDPKYEDKNIYIMFEDKKDNQWYLYPHDELKKYNRTKNLKSSKSTKGYTTTNPSKDEKRWLSEYKVN